MAYPAPFHRLVMLGDLYTDRFNTTLSIVPSGGGTLPAVSDDLVEAVGTFVGDWWPRLTGATPNPGCSISSAAKLTSVKLNRIGTDGKYVDAETKEHIYSSPIVGGYATVGIPQLTLAATLRGSNERARGGKGRMYLPPTENTVMGGIDGRISAARALDYAKGVSALLAGINDVYLTEGVSAVAGVASKQGSGAFQTVVQVSVGRVVDTIRSRRSKLDEDPQFWGMP